jgi:hypothetical protein
MTFLARFSLMRWMLRNTTWLRNGPLSASVNGGNFGRALTQNISVRKIGKNFGRRCELMRDRTTETLIALVMGLLGFGGWYYLLICFQNMGV